MQILDVFVLKWNTIDSMKIKFHPTLKLRLAFTFTLLICFFLKKFLISYSDELQLSTNWKDSQVYLRFRHFSRYSHKFFAKLFSTGPNKYYILQKFYDCFNKLNFLSTSKIFHSIFKEKEKEKKLCMSTEQWAL